MRAIITNILRPVFPLLFYFRFRRLLKLIEKCFIESHDNFFFFPTYQLGGAEKIHLQILKTIPERKKVIFITNKSSADTLKNEFEELSNCFVDFGQLGNHPYFQKKLIKILVQKFNATNHTCTLFGCNSFIFYDVIDSLDNKKLKTVDLIHAFSPYTHGIENRAFRSVHKLHERIVINKKTKEDLKEQYSRNHIDESEIQKIKLIYNPLLAQCLEIKKHYDTYLKCLWVGRGSKEKRPWLFAKVAKVCAEKNMPFRFTMIGDVLNFIPKRLRKYVDLQGAIYDLEKTTEHYKNNDLLLTTSLYEGFPTTITEAVCNDVINVSIDVGGISEHIINNETGYLINDSTDEDIIINNFIECLKYIASNTKEMTRIRKNAIIYVNKTFSVYNFNTEYQKVLSNE